MNHPNVALTHTPKDITAGLTNGSRYLAQVSVFSDPGLVVYCTSELPLNDLADWFSAEPGEFFSFVASRDCPTWARTFAERTVAGSNPAHAKLAIGDWQR